MTKEMILKYDWFIANSYLDDYLAIVNQGQTDQSNIFSNEYHHIIPACWYRLRFPKTSVSGRYLANHDINEEIVKLSRKDHIKAHELLIKCTAGDFNSLLKYAYERMIKLTSETGKLTDSKIKKTVIDSEALISKREKKWKTRMIYQLTCKLYWQANETRLWSDCKKEAAELYDMSH